MPMIKTKKHIYLNKETHILPNKICTNKCLNQAIELNTHHMMVLMKVTNVMMMMEMAMRDGR